MRADEVDTLLRELGWAYDRQRGSHRLYKHDHYPGALLVSWHGRTFEPMHWRRLLGNLRRLGAWAQADWLEARYGRYGHAGAQREGHRDGKGQTA